MTDVFTYASPRCVDDVLCDIQERGLDARLTIQLAKETLESMAAWAGPMAKLRRRWGGI
jgi:hypothetical protein